MQTQVMILSADAVFARMLEIEFQMQGIETGVAANGNDLEADVVLLDLDSAMPPSAKTYRHMIGFTERETPLGEGACRLCSIVLRRPFELRLLSDEVRSLLRGDVAREMTRLRVGQTLQVSETGAVTLPSGRTVTLSPKECVVFRLLADAKGKPVARQTIARALGESTSNKADVYVCYLRKKLETPTERVIRTVRGEGYSLMV